MLKQTQYEYFCGIGDVTVANITIPYGEEVRVLCCPT